MYTLLQSDMDIIKKMTPSTTSKTSAPTKSTSSSVRLTVVLPSHLGEELSLLATEILTTQYHGRSAPAKQPTMSTRNTTTELLQQTADNTERSCSGAVIKYLNNKRSHRL